MLLGLSRRGVVGVYGTRPKDFFREKSSPCSASITTFEIRPAPDQLPGLLFVPVPELKSLKNRLHLDFRPDDQDREVDRLLGLGAVRVDVGQGEQPWVVLADPEGNEFCVLGERSTN